jgi:hypothetical protein
MVIHRSCAKKIKSCPKDAKPQRNENLAPLSLRGYFTAAKKYKNLAPLGLRGYFILE